MEWETYVAVLYEFGYGGLFLWLWLGMFIFPVPNEIIMISVGWLSNDYLQMVPAFIAAYFGIIASTTTMFLIGRFAGAPLLSKLVNRTAIKKGKKMIDNHGTYALLFCCFFAGIRHAIPFLCGTRKLSFLTFALVSYTSCFIWCTIFFSFGKYIVVSGIESLQQHNIYLVSILVFVIAVVGFFLKNMFFGSKQEDDARSYTS
ncbi:DedA family protein [Alkalihalobacterium alkalinitrilicum]|uniref:DedA family protein n=1 Tax=Alkalihalobacterium alkalinitrilicum TaxID=427920 RepID=UPI000995DEED|nr:DedA family protein [Alkalihalobacterium alkalinitrilicum]